MFAENGEVMEDETVIEFRYDLDAEPGWRWKPIRVRHDKTEDYRRGDRKFGNDYNVANNNWHSIHTPVTPLMLSTGGDIPDTADDSETYYATSDLAGRSQTRGLRDFHNLFVKRFLVNIASNSGDTMIDFAVGKGGDIPKWIHGKLSFVYGLDISVDNIENKSDGCCARYLNYRTKYHTVPDCIFAHADSGKLIRNGDAFYSDRGGMTNDALVGKGKKDSSVLGKGVYRMYGRVKDGFDVASIQFALHYMCKDVVTFHNFIRNVCENVKNGGYFIATCYDGPSIITKLRNKELGAESALYRNKKKIWGVTKQYTDESFIPDETSLGKAIDVFQETINKVFREYLVHPTYLVETFGHYGFDLVTSEDMPTAGGGTGLFSELHRRMLDTTASDTNIRNYGTANRMSIEEREISFLNRYYILKKNRVVDAKAIYEKLIK